MLVPSKIGRLLSNIPVKTRTVPISFVLPFFPLLTLFSRVPAPAMMGVNEGGRERSHWTRLERFFSSSNETWWFCCEQRNRFSPLLLLDRAAAAVDQSALSFPSEKNVIFSLPLPDFSFFRSFVPRPPLLPLLEKRDACL